MYGMVSL